MPKSHHEELPEIVTTTGSRMTELCDEVAAARHGQTGGPTVGIPDSDYIDGTDEDD